MTVTKTSVEEAGLIPVHQIQGSTLSPSIFQVPRVIYCPRRTIHLLAVKLMNRVGALNEVLSILAALHINIVSITTPKHTHQVGEPIEMNIFIDMSSCQESCGELEVWVKNCKSVVGARIIQQQLRGITVDDTHFPMQMLGTRAIIAREPAYGALIVGIRERFGSAGEALLYHVGLDAGYGLLREAAKLGIRNSDIPQWFRLEELLTGRSSLEVIELQSQILPETAYVQDSENVGAAPSSTDGNNKKERVIVRINNSFECALVAHSEKPYSHFYRGLIAGLFSEMIDKLQVKETKCIAMGDSYCEFLAESNPDGQPNERFSKV